VIYHASLVIAVQRRKKDLLDVSCASGYTRLFILSTGYTAFVGNVSRVGLGTLRYAPLKG